MGCQVDRSKPMLPNRNDTVELKFFTKGSRLMPGNPDRKDPRRRVARWFWTYAASCLVIWWILSEGDPKAWIVGIPTVFAAAAASTLLAPPTAWQCRPRYILPFAWQFFAFSIEGGVDVARRAFALQLRLDPGLMEYHTHLPEGTARVFFANVISLCPGTVSAHLDGDRLKIHVLDCQQPTSARLAEMESVIARLFGGDAEGYHFRSDQQQ